VLIFRFQGMFSVCVLDVSLQMNTNVVESAKGQFEACQKYHRCVDPDIHFEPHT